MHAPVVGPKNEATAAGGDCLSFAGVQGERRPERAIAVGSGHGTSSDRTKQYLPPRNPAKLVIGDNDPAGNECTQRLKAAGLAAHVLFSDVDGEDARELRNRLGPTGFTSLINDALTEKESEK